MSNFSNYVGIDVAKKDFYACFDEQSESRKFNNTALGFNSFVRHLYKNNFQIQKTKPNQSPKSKKRPARRVFGSLLFNSLKHSENQNKNSFKQFPVLVQLPLSASLQKLQTLKDSNNPSNWSPTLDLIPEFINPEHQFTAKDISANEAIKYSALAFTTPPVSRFFTPISFRDSFKRNDPKASHIKSP